MPTELPNCVVCRNPFDPDALTFEQRLIGDREFCVKCWSEIMNSSMDDVEIELPVI